MKMLKNVAAVAMAGVMIMSAAGCKALKIEKVSSGDFTSAVEDNTGIELNEYSYEGIENLYFYNDWYYIDYFEYEDADEAKDVFEDAYDSFDSAKSHNDFSGSSKYVCVNDYGYFLFNGEVEGSGFIAPLSDEYESIASSLDGDVYGGVFWADDMIMVVITRSDDKEDKDYINAILSDLGYPKP